MNQPPVSMRTLGGIVLGIAAAGLAWQSYATSIASFRQQEGNARNAIASLHERLGDARAAIHNVRTQEEQAQQIRAQIATLLQALPEGAAATWMPEVIKQHFAAFGLEASTVRMNAVRAEPDLPNLRRGYWSVGVPLAAGTRRATAPLLAVAEFEQQHSFIKVLDFAIRPDPENPQGQVMLMNVAALIRK